jgi:hypothetical protein
MGIGKRIGVVALIAILVVAVAFRTWRLNSVPPGLTHDEASNGHDAAAILRGVRPIYFTVGYGHEPLYPYSVAFLMAFLGTTDLTLRLTTVLWGSGLILLTYLLSRRLFGTLPALIAAAWMALSFWCVMTSRVGLRAVTSATMFAASAYAFWRAVPLPWGTSREQTVPGSRLSWLWWVVSGVFLGASIYTYMASRAMPAVYVLFLVYLAAFHVFGRRQEDENKKDMNTRDANTEETKHANSRHLLAGAKSPDYESGWSMRVTPGWIVGATVGVVVLLLIAAAVAAPLVRYLMTHPEAERRLDQLSGPIEDALHGHFGALWDHVSRSLPMFTIRGDPLWLYNIPGRPLLDVPSGAFFYAGLFVCLWRWRDPRHGFLLLWLAAGVGPALVTGPDATALRSIIAQPVLFIIAALGLTTVVGFLYRRCGRWGRIATASAVVALLVVTGGRTAHAYFDVWAQHRDVRVAYHHALVEQAHYLDAQAEGGAVALSSIYPGRFHDPYTMEVTLRRDDLSMRWFDGRNSLLFPAEGQSRVVIPTIAPLDEVLLPMFVPQATLVHTERFRPDDLVTHFDVYRFDADDALADLMPTVRGNPVFWSPSDAFPVAHPQSTYEPLSLPINVGGVVDLVGYEVLEPTVEPGGEVVLLTVWRVRDAGPGLGATHAVARAGHRISELVAFTHVLDPDGSVVGQRDRLDVPSWHWRPGDAFVQLHRFPIEADLAPGHYSLEVGFYTREGSKRLPVIVGDAAVDDRVLLRPLEVAGP